MVAKIKDPLRKADKRYFFCARIQPIQLKKLNAIMYTSRATNADLLNGILDVFDMMCTNGQDEILRKLFGNEFYLRFFDKYLDNLYAIEKFEQNIINEKLKSHPESITSTPSDVDLVKDEN